MRIVSISQLGVSLLLVLVGMAVGFRQGYVGTRLAYVLCAAVALMLTANVWETLPYYGPDPTTWFRTYYSGFLMTILGLLAFYAAPVLVSYGIARLLSRRNERRRGVG